jgi:hypothetical protein
MSDRPARWSKQDDADLKRIIRQGSWLKEAATILERSVRDVQCA